MQNAVNVLVNFRLAHQEQTRYVFQTFGQILGINFDIKTDQEKFQNSSEHIRYGLSAAGNQKVLTIPADNYDDWQNQLPDVVWKEGTPFLHLKKNSSHLMGYTNKENGTGLDYDIVLACFYCLARLEEKSNKKRDQWGCFSARFTHLNTLGVLEWPIVNYYALFIKKALMQLYPGVFNFSCVWKDNKDFAIAMVHDMDCPFKGDMHSGLELIKQSLFLNKGFRQGLKVFINGLKNRISNKVDPYFNIYRYMQIEKRFNFKSSFNVTALSNSRHMYDPSYNLEHPVIRQGLKEAHKDGWEINLHASFRAGRQPRLLAQEKERFERVMDIRCRGISQHYLRVDVENTWRYYWQCGFIYDTSLGYNEAIGFRAGIASPFFPYDFQQSRSLGLVELPVIIMDGVLFTTFGLDRQQAQKRIIRLLKRIKDVHGFGVILWHLRVLDEREYNDWAKTYEDVLAFLAEQQAWVTSPGEIARFWLERVEKLSRYHNPTVSCAQ